MMIIPTLVLSINFLKTGDIIFYNMLHLEYIVVCLLGIWSIKFYCVRKIFSVSSNILSSSRYKHRSLFYALKSENFDEWGNDPLSPLWQSRLLIHFSFGSPLNFLELYQNYFLQSSFFNI